jgi:16S rRNA processing protein RimM
MTAPGEEQWLCVGRIGGAYGIKGWVRVHAYTDAPETFLTLKGCHLARGEGDEQRRPVEVLEGRVQGKGLVVHLAGVEDRTAAERLRGQEFWVPAEQLPALEEGEYYWRDLEGLRVFAEAGEGTVLLGRVDHLLETGANDVLVVAPCEGSVDRRERLIPYLPGDVVVAVEPQQQQMLVRWHPDD